MHFKYEKKPKYDGLEWEQRQQEIKELLKISLVANYYQFLIIWIEVRVS